MTKFTQIRQVVGGVSVRTFLIITLGLAAIVRLVGLTKASIWHDEGYTMMLAPMPLAEIIERTARDVHPPLYYLKLHVWMSLFGSSELSARGFSLVLGVATVAIVYLLVRQLVTEAAARLAAIFVAIGPFAVRYSQEARMYAMASFLITLSTYALVKALKSNSWNWWGLYGLSIAAALYTHYYAVFVIPIHLGYAWWHYGNLRKLLSNLRWWAANLLGAGLFALWLPTAYAQFSRVQGGFWIPEPTVMTLPRSLAQLLTFTDLSDVPNAVTVTLTAVAVVATGWMLVRWKAYRRGTVLLAAIAIVPPVLVVLISLGRPVYVDRYFVYCAIAAYALIGVAIATSSYLRRNPAKQLAVTALVVALFAAGNYAVYVQANHQMRAIGNYVTEHYELGDSVVSGELYTYFDFSYYNHTGAELQLLAPNGLSGHGESSLIYDRADEIVVKSLADVRPVSGRVWLVGKTGDKDYYKQVPASWRQVGAPIQAGYCEARLYQVDAAPIAASFRVY